MDRLDTFATVLIISLAICYLRVQSITAQHDGWYTVLVFCTLRLYFDWYTLYPVINRYHYPRKKITVTKIYITCHYIGMAIKLYIYHERYLILKTYLCSMLKTVY